MKKIKGLKVLVVLAVVVGLLVGATAAQAIVYTAAEFCTVVLGYSWAGNAHDGSCYFYAPACATYPLATGMYLVYHIWDDGFGGIIIGSVQVCVPAPSSGPGPNIDLVKGEEEGGTASAKDWHVDYPAGACESPCRLTANGMTNAASKASLPGMVSSVYYKTDSPDPYLVCYDGGDANALYQFVSGEWVPAPTTWYGDSICTTAVGPGAFAAVME